MTGTPEPAPALRPVGDTEAAFCDPESGDVCAVPAPTTN